GLQARSNDLELKQLLVQVNDSKTWFCVQAERELLRMLGGGCQLPLGVRTRLNNDDFWMEAILFRDEAAPISGFVSGVFSDPTAAAVALLDRIYEEGKKRFLQSCWRRAGGHG